MVIPELLCKVVRHNSLIQPKPCTIYGYISLIYKSVRNLLSGQLLRQAVSEEKFPWSAEDPCVQEIYGTFAIAGPAPFMPVLLGARGTYALFFLQPLKHQGSVSAAESKAVGHHSMQFHRVHQFPDNGQILRGRLQLGDIGGGWNKPAFQHKQ